MRKIMSIMLIFTFFPLFAGDGNAILKQVEERLIGEKAPKDMHSLMVMTIVDSHGNKKVREIEAWEKNNRDSDDWRVMKFRKPADVKGVGFLVLSEDQMYLYLPEFHRIRRVASHSKKEAFMGSDFSYDDMGTSGFIKYYNATVLNETSREYVLELKRKAGAKKPYSKIKLWVPKESMVPSKMELYDNSGELTKVAVQSIKKIGKYWIPVKIKMNSVKKGTYTILEMKYIEVDKGLSPKIFTKRFLKRR